MTELWACPKCNRALQAGKSAPSLRVGDKSSLLRGRSPALARLYNELEKAVLACDGVEIVYRDKVALFRTSRIFADLVDDERMRCDWLYYLTREVK